MTDQYTFKNPVTAYEHISPPEQSQPEPGLDAKLTPKADLGEDTYRGTGRLEGRKALVTGADSGIGAATAIAFAREGADVVLSYLPEEEEDAARIANLIEKAGRKAVKVPGDLKDSATCRELVDTALRELGGLDILVNNAGKQVAQEDIGEITDEQFDHTLKTNVYAMFWLTKAAVPHLPAGSTIINTTSIQAYNPSPTLVDYATTKASINNFTKGLAQQLAPKGIRVNAVAPGPIWTPLQPSSGQPTEALPEFGKNTPLGRAGQPAELAPAYVFLASAESSYVVGETLERQRRQPDALAQRRSPAAQSGSLCPDVGRGTMLPAAPMGLPRCGSRLRGRTAVMECITWFAPILPGKMEAWKALVGEMKGARAADHKRSRERMGMTREVVSLMQTPQGDFVMPVPRGRGPGAGVPDGRVVGRSL